jgi:hypothetical protein
MNKIRAHRKGRIIGKTRQAEAHRQKLESEDRQKGDIPSAHGWGQHKSRKNKVSLFDPFKGGK